MIVAAKWVWMAGSAVFTIVKSRQPVKFAKLIPAKASQGLMFVLVIMQTVYRVGDWMIILYNENHCFHRDTIKMLLNEMEVFYYVVELKSFSGAATKLGVSKSFISKKITQLEQELKARLLSRSTRKLTLTEAGLNFYQSCAKVVHEADTAYGMMGELHGKPAGTLRISMPPALGVHLIAPLLANFSRQYPEIRFDIQLENRIVDLIEESYDLVLRVAKLQSSNLITRRITRFKNVICATPKYLRQHGMPKIPHDLERHNCAIYSFGKHIRQLKFLRSNKEYIISVTGNFFSNQLELIKQVVLDDVCLAVLPEFMVSHEFKQQRLQSCLDSFKLPIDPVYAIYPEREFMPPKVRVFIEMLQKTFHS